MCQALSYRLVNLKAKEFQFRVRAEKDEAFSQWSDYESFDFKTQDAIDVVHCLPVSNKRFLYDLGGYRACENYKHGVFIVIRNGKVYKVLK